MSRAFVKEDADTAPVAVTVRPPLPPGVKNLVTESGLAALRAELRLLTDEEAELAATGEADAGSEALRRLAALGTEIPDLEHRLQTAVLVPKPPPGTAVVQVGAVVVTRDARSSKSSRFRIVGVDEADPLAGLVSFTAPISQALLGRSPGDRVTFDAGSGPREVTLEAVEYPD